LQLPSVRESADNGGRMTLASRACCCLAALAACGGHKPSPVAEPVPVAPADAPVAPGESTTTDAAGSGVQTPTPTVDAGADAASGTASAADVSGVVAAYCLYVGAEERVVQCYWKRDDCDRQVAFNKEYGSTRPQECRPSSVVFCLTPSASSETCYPTAAGCAEMYGKLVARNRPTSECVEKRGPAT